MEDFFKGMLEGTMADVFSTPVGQLVRRGTDESLAGPEWQCNMEIVDMLNVGGREVCADCIKAVSAVLKQSADNRKAVYLALIILEASIKNCRPIAGHINAAFMQEMVALAKGSKGKKIADEAARLIQQWGREFEKDRAKVPHFFDTLVALRAKGVSFPSEDRGGYPGGSSYEDDLPAVFMRVDGPSMTLDPLDPSYSEALATSFVYPDPLDPCPVASQSTITNASEFERLDRDLSTVEDKVKLCHEMLVESPGIQADELLAEVVGFLEACRDRLAEVIESGTQGVLGEAAVGRCLRVHDAVLRTLELEKSGCGPVGGDSVPPSRE